MSLLASFHSNVDKGGYTIVDEGGRVMTVFFKNSAFLALGCLLFWFLNNHVTRA